MQKLDARGSFQAAPMLRKKILLQTKRLQKLRRLQQPRKMLSSPSLPCLLTKKMLKSEYMRMLKWRRNQLKK